MKKLIPILSMFLMLMSCEEEISVNNLSSDSIVIEAFIYTGQPIDSIYISKVVPYTADAIEEPLSGYDIIIDNGDETFELDDLGAGYYAKLDHIVAVDKEYTIRFEYDNKVISAATYTNPAKSISLSQETVALEKIEFNGGIPSGGLGAESVTIDISWDNIELDYYFVDVAAPEGDPEYVNEIFELIADNDDLPERIFRSEPQITDTHSINSRRELQFYGTYEVTVYRLNPEYAALYESVGSSSISLDEPPTNVVNGLGIFTAVTPHKISFNVIKG